MRSRTHNANGKVPLNVVIIGVLNKQTTTTTAVTTNLKAVRFVTHLTTQ